MRPSMIGILILAALILSSSPFVNTAAADSITFALNTKASCPENFSSCDVTTIPSIGTVTIQDGIPNLYRDDPSSYARYNGPFGLRFTINTSIPLGPVQITVDTYTNLRNPTIIDGITYDQQSTFDGIPGGGEYWQELIVGPLGIFFGTVNMRFNNSAQFDIFAGGDRSLTLADLVPPPDRVPDNPLGVVPTIYSPVTVWGSGRDTALYGANTIPEPTSLLLFSTGLVGIGMAAWRRKK